MQAVANKQFRWFAAGLLFAALWASASVATKIGLGSAQPLVIAEVRFAIASFIMLLIARVFLRQRFPSGKIWWQLAVYGLLNITIYLGAYVIAMQNVTAGIGTLAVATNPIFISCLSVFFLKKKIGWVVVLSLLICTIGVVCASWPLFKNAMVTTTGLLILFFSMISYSAGAIYFSAKDWKGLHLLTINGWQTFIGGIFLLPVTLIFYKRPLNQFDATFWKSIGWLAVPVSIIGVQLWLWLLKTNAVRAGLWLFLCPLFGFLFAAWLMKDEISGYTVTGMVMVVTGLLLARQNLQKDEVPID